MDPNALTAALNDALDQIERAAVAARDAARQLADCVAHPATAPIPSPELAPVAPPPAPHAGPDAHAPTVEPVAATAPPAPAPNPAAPVADPIPVPEPVRAAPTPLHPDACRVADLPGPASGGLLVFREPNSRGHEGTSYHRMGTVFEFRGTVTVRAEFRTRDRTRRINDGNPLQYVVLDPALGVVRESPVLTGPYDWSFDAGGLQNGVILTARTPLGMDVDSVIGFAGPPSLAPQWVPDDLHSMIGEKDPDLQTFGWQWWDGVSAIGRPNPNRPQPATTLTSPPKYEHLYQEALTRYYGTNNLLHEMGSWKGRVVIDPYQQYFASDMSYRRAGTGRDGAKNQASFAHVVCLRPLSDGSRALVTEMNGRVAWLTAEGEATTIAGTRLKQHALAPNSDDTHEERMKAYERVGDWSAVPLVGLKSPFAASFDPAHDNRVYICDTDHHRVLMEHHGTITQLAGSGKGEAGYADGPLGANLLNKPRDARIGPDGRLYISDAGNQAIRRLESDGSLTTVVRSAKLFDHHALHQYEALGTVLKMRDAIHQHEIRDGAFGEAVFIHPQQMAFDSDGNIITACHHEYALKRIDLQARTVTTLTRLDVSSMAMSAMAHCWIALDVDSAGALGIVDRIAVAYWMQNSQRWYGKNGKWLTHPGANDGFYSGASGGGWFTGPGQHLTRTDYPWAVGFDHIGSLWHSGNAGEGVYRLRAKLPTDWQDIDTPRAQRGGKIYTEKSPTNAGSLFLAHGYRGQNAFGGEGFYDVAGLDPAAFAAHIRGPWGRPDLSDTQIADLHYYAQVCSL